MSVASDSDAIISAARIESRSSEPVSLTRATVPQNVPSKVEPASDAGFEAETAGVNRRDIRLPVGDCADARDSIATRPPAVESRPSAAIGVFRYDGAQRVEGEGEERLVGRRLEF